MSGIFLSYLSAVLISAIGLTAGVLFIKKGLKYSFKLGSFSCGIIVALVGLMSIFMLFEALFDTSEYYNTPIFRTVVGLVILSLFCFLRFLLVRGILFNRDREEVGLSFSFGFGAAPVALFGIYALVLTVVLALNVIFNAPYTIGEDGLTFADNTMISVPVSAVSQTFYALSFVLYAVIVVASAVFLDRTVKQPCRGIVFTFWSIAFFILEGGAILTARFANTYLLHPWQITLVLGLLAAMAIALLIFLPAMKKKPSTYTKQFE